MSATVCAEGDCTEKALARGLCSRHYQRARRRNELPPSLRRVSLVKPHRLTNVDRTNATADCSRCGQGVPIRIGKGRGNECKTQHNASKNKEITRKRWYKYKYGVTFSERERMAEEQHHTCPVCRTVTDQLVVDHCHSTGRVRGLLCHHCNLAIGFLRDNPATAVAAAVYLLDS
ncbi:endonuclease VII domain-containing protein [Streptomyces sp. NPDC046859]|uniref:endonuclease VII domain-containing protein n=1 Tax=Streptomyces sp. NPDC046859 TaxID=3155734 RepID=UPI0034001BDF